MNSLKKRTFFNPGAKQLAVCAFLVAGACMQPVMADNLANEAIEGVMQQKNVTVKGTVKDKSGEAIIGASVKVKGSATGTITDVNGNFTLNVRPGAVLEISYVGYKPQTVTTRGGQNIRITLTEDSKVMDEVVVIGYGTQKKGDVTSAVASVKADDFTIGNIGDAGDLIKGKVAGLNITKGNGDPNDVSAIRLRGVISLEGSSTPLVLVDGIEGSLNTVAPENIESIDVLKDASAAAIYGTRGANGVIIITTKTGKRDTKCTSSYSGYISASNFAKKLDFMDGSDVRAGHTNFTDKGYDTDWLDAISRTAFTQNHNFNITGGNETTTYSADFTYRHAQGVIIDTYNDEMKMHMNVSHWMLDNMLKVSFDLQKSWHKNSVTNASNGDNTNIYHQAIIRNPTSPITNEDGSWNENLSVSYYYNPVAMIKEIDGEYKTEDTRMTGNFTFEPIKGWQTNLMLATDRYNTHTSSFYTSNYFSNVMNSYSGQASHNYGYGKTDNLELTSKYSTTVGQHRFDALVGYSYQYDEYEGFYAYNRDFPTDFFKYNNIGIGAALKDGNASMSSDKSDDHLIGFFGRISYGYANKYNALVSIRHEGSSKFGDNHKWGNFPSASLGWTISNEEFMKGFTWLNSLKLRAGFGVTGIIPNASYVSLTKYNYGDNYYYQNGKWKAGLDVASNPNPDLKWEKSTEYNIGVDFSVLGDRLGGSIDFYNKKTSDLLWDYTVPTPPNLYTTTTANVGKIRNYGIEILINAIPFKTKDFEWKTTFTGSYNKNKLLSLSNDLYETENHLDMGWLGEPITIATHRMEVGKAVDNYFGLKSVGVSENGKFLIENPTTGKAEEFTANMLTNDTYRQYLGHGLPNFYLGWNNTFKYRDFDLSMQFTSQLGFKILNEARCFYENNAVAFNRLKSVLDAPYGGQYTLSNQQPQTFVSYYLENGDFVKLTNITLGYTVPLKPNKYVSNVRAYVSADNLFCITGYDGLDPELSNNTMGYYGNDYRDKYPSTRSFTFGVNVTF
jgi:TonB-linked SusC/RagA family outer membrane protein